MVLGRWDRGQRPEITIKINFVRSLKNDRLYLAKDRQTDRQTDLDLDLDLIYFH